MSSRHRQPVGAIIRRTRGWIGTIRRPLAMAGLALAVTGTGLALGPAAPASAATSTNEQAYDYFVAHGLTPTQSAAIVGNFMQETVDPIDPTMYQTGGGKGRGIGQWSIGERWDTAPGDNVVAWAGSASPWSLDTQLGFTWYELTTFGHYGLADLRAATSLDAAVTAFESKFESCGECQHANRVAFAQKVLTAYGSTGAPAAFRVAFAGSSTPTLYTYDSATGAAALGQGMLAGTSPAITRVPSGYESAFVANTGNLVLYGDALKGNTNQPVAAGSSPAITRTSDGHLVAAYRAASNGALRLWVDGTIVDTAQGVRANTSPAIAAGPNGTYRVAFQASSGTLFTYDSTTGPANTGNGMATTSSPAITAVNGGYEMAAIINTGELITLGPLGNRRTAQGAQTGTSPDIAASPDGTGFRVAFQANTGYLYTYDSTTGPANTGNGLATDASPAITTVAGGYEMAARINTGALIVLGNTTNSNTAQGITAHTNPALP